MERRQRFVTFSRYRRSYLSPSSIVSLSYSLMAMADCVTQLHRYRPTPTGSLLLERWHLCYIPGFRSFLSWYPHNYSPRIPLRILRGPSTLHRFAMWSTGSYRFWVGIMECIPNQAFPRARASSHPQSKKYLRTSSESVDRLAKLGRTTHGTMHGCRNTRCDVYLLTTNL